MDIPVFVINLEGSIDRRDHTTRQLDDLGIHYQILKAIGRDHSAVMEVLKQQGNIEWGKGLKRRYLLKEEIGCVLSHMIIYKKMQDENIAVACILEDDNDYKRDFKELLNYELLKVVDWDLLYLGHNSEMPNRGAKCRKTIALPIKNYKIGIPIEFPYCTKAYIIKRNAANKLLENCYPIRMPADYYTGNAYALGVKTYVFSPPYIHTNPDFKSTICGDSKFVFLHPRFMRIISLLHTIYVIFPWLLYLRIWLCIKFPHTSLVKVWPEKNSTSPPPKTEA